MGRRLLDWFVRDWALKLTALTLAFMLWTTVQADTISVSALSVRVLVQNNDAEWVVAQQPMPDSLPLNFRGSIRDLMKFLSAQPQVVATFDNVTDSVQTARVTQNSVRMPPNMQGVEVIPFASEVRVVFDRVVTRLVPVAAPLQGTLPRGFEMYDAPMIDPPVVRASGPGRSISRVDSLRLPAIDISNRVMTDTVTLTIDTTGTGLIVSPRTVRVILPIRAMIPDSGAAIPLMGQPSLRGPGG